MAKNKIKAAVSVLLLLCVAFFVLGGAVPYRKNYQPSGESPFDGHKSDYYADLFRSYGTSRVPVLNEEYIKGDFGGEEAEAPSETTTQETLTEGEIPHAHDKVTEGETETTVGEDEGDKTKNEEAPETDGRVVLDVPYIYQRVKYPNGCESVSAVMALQYLGVDIDVDRFIDDYLDMGRSLYWRNGRANACDPRDMFPGNPKDDTGWGCYPEVIKKAADKMSLSDIDCTVLKDASLHTLCSEYIDNDIPVVFWGTIDMTAPSEWVSWTIDDGSERQHTWTSPFHCLLLVGYDKDSYYFNDPWQKKSIPYPKDKVEVAYSGMGREALVFTKKAEITP